MKNGWFGGRGMGNKTISVMREHAMFLGRWGCGKAGVRDPAFCLKSPFPVLSSIMHRCQTWVEGVVERGGVPCCSFCMSFCFSKRAACLIAPAAMRSTGRKACLSYHQQTSLSGSCYNMPLSFSFLLLVQSSSRNEPHSKVPRTVQTVHQP